MAGSLDDNPTVVLFADEYAFCLVGHAGEGFTCYRSRKEDISTEHLVARLRTIADAIEQGSTHSNDTANAG